MKTEKFLKKQKGNDYYLVEIKMTHIKRNILTQRHRVTNIFSVLLCLCGLIFFSCSKKQEKIPQGIIPKDKMVHVMADIHIAEAHAQFNGVFDDAKSIRQGYYKFIFAKYKINSGQLMKSWTFYASHPAIFSGIYEEVITELSKRQAEELKEERPKIEVQKK